MQARAFTFDTYVWLRRGVDMQPGRLSAHELAHVVHLGAAPPRALLAPPARCSWRPSGLVQRAPDSAQDFIDDHESVGGAQLDETTLGNDLRKLTLESDDNVGFVLSVFDTLWSSDRDDVAYAFVEPMTDAQLAALAARAAAIALLQRLRSEMTGGLEFRSEATQIARLDAALAGPAPGGDPTVLAEAVAAALADGLLDRGDWLALRHIGQPLGESALVNAFVAAGFGYPAAGALALLTLGAEPALAALTDDYQLPVADQATVAWTLASGAIVEFFDDMALSRDEFSALRQLYFALKDDLIDELGTSASVNERGISQLSALIRNEGGRFDTVLAGDTVFPMRFVDRADEGIATERDLAEAMLPALMTDGSWDFDDVKLVQSLTGAGHHSAQQVALLEGVGIVSEHARLLAKRMPLLTSRKLPLNELALDFEPAGGGWRLSEVAVFNLQLPEFGAVPLPPAIPIDTTAGPAELRAGVLMSAEPEPELRADAYVVMLSAAGATLEVVVPLSAPAPLESFVTSVHQWLDHVPPQHIGFIASVLSYPGRHPGDTAAADADRSNRRIRVFDGKPVSAEMFVHEVGHLVSFNAAADDRSFWPRWEDAMISDRFAPSLYGMTSKHEDFAEAYYLFHATGGKDQTLRDRYPARFSILDGLF